MANTRELSQLASIINIIDQTKSIGIITEYPDAKVGIGTLLPTSKVDVVGDVNVSGAITATIFYGDGSNLSGIIAGVGSEDSINTTGIITASSFYGDGSNITGLSTFSGNYNDLTNKPSIPSIVGLASEGYVTQQIFNLVDSAPETLDTLNELASALGDDANFSTTITNSLANKANLSGANFTGVVTATSFSGTLTGTATSTTNIPNLTGAITSNNTTTSLGSFTSAQLAAALTDETGTGANVFATSPTLVTPALGTPSSGTLTNCTFPTLNQNTTGSAATLTTGRTIAITGDLTYTSGSFNGSANVTGTGTLATVNNNVGTFGSGSVIPTITVNAKGLITGVTTTAVTSGTTITDDTSTNATRYLTFTSATSGSISAANVSSTKLTFNPSTGNLSAIDFNSTSDINLKENITPIENPIEKIIQLSGVTFNWKSSHQSSAGVIAQEVEKVLPEIVRENDGHKSVSYNGLIGLLIEVVKDQQRQIDELKSRL